MAPNTTGSSQAGPSAAANTAAPENTPTSLEELVQFLATTRNTAQVKKALQNFGSKETRDTLLAGSLAGEQDPLDLLDPAANTLGCLYILSARLSVQGAPPPQLSALETFCKVFNPEQARQAPERVTLLAKGIAKASADNLKYALTPLRDLVLRYPPTLSHLTTIHPIYLNACVTTRHYTAALPLLTTPILHIDTTLSDLHYNDNLLYHYAGGVAFGALKRWREAEEFFEIVATAPAHAPAAIQFEALKKLTLVQLILYGKALPTPKYTHQNLTRLLKSSPYQTLVRTYPQTVTALQNTLKQDVEAFRTDKNLGLVQQVIERAPRWLIRKLTSTYLTLGLADIGREVGIESEDEVRSVIANMVENDEINASISVDGTVTFFDPTPQFSKADVDAALSQAQAQSKLLFELERALNTSREFLSKAIKHKDESWGPAGQADDDVALYGHGGGHPMGGSPWAEESMFA